MNKIIEVERPTPLNQVRINAKLSLPDCATQLQISTYYLAHIENKQFDKLPKGPYCPGYIRKYCQLLEVEPAPYLKEYTEYASTLPDSDFTLPKMYNIHLTSRYQHKQFKTFYGLAMAFMLFLGFGVIANQDLLMPELSPLAQNEQQGLEVAFTEELSSKEEK